MFRISALAFFSYLSVVSGAAKPNSDPNGTQSWSHQPCAASMNGQLPATTPSDFHFSGNVRRYYVAAEEVEWNYTPTGYDNWMGVPINDSTRAQASGYTTYGTTWLKALYRGYTDASFTKLTEQGPWQGTQGPLLRGEVGDMLEIMFVNKLSKNYATMHSMGLAYNKMDEGADYPGSPVPGQNSSIPLGDAVPPVERGLGPGECVVYKWLANKASGPNNGQVARSHSYHSYVDLDVDTNSGLIGTSIVYASGEMASTMQKYKEFPLLYMIYNESNSFLSGENAQRLGGMKAASSFGSPDKFLWSGNYSIWHPQQVNLGDAGQFSGAPQFYTMNGYTLANNAPFTMCQTDQAIWYVSGYGAASHVFHMHGNGFTYQGENRFAISLNDGVSKTLFMTAVDKGLWQVICHVNNHHQMGMVSNYLVKPAGQC